MVERLDGLRHHPVVRRHHQNGDIRDLRSPRTHGGERLMAGRVQERDDPAVLMDLVRADVLRDPSELLGNHVRSTDRVQEQRLPVIDVAHDGDDGRARNEPALVDRLFGLLLDLHLGGDDLDRPAKLGPDQLDGVVGQRLTDRHHLARLEKQLDDVRGG